MVVYKGRGFRDSRRKAPRMELPQGITISVKLEFEDGFQCSARCINLNVTGILVEVPPEHISQVTVDRKILLSLILGEEDTGMIPGIIRHCAECHVGILLPAASTRTAKQNDHLHRILRIIEREKLRQNTQGEFE